MTLRIRFEHTLYPHLGSRSGYIQLARHLDRESFAIELHEASDSDADLPAALKPAAPLLRRLVRRRGVAWYKLSDLVAELRAAPACLAGRLDIIHFLDGEHSPQYLPRLLKRLSRSATKVVATFHQPPSLLRELVPDELLSWLDHVILMAPSQAAFFRQYLPRDRVSVLLHGIDTEFFRPASEARLERQLRCISAGHWLRDWKAIARTAEALRKEHDITFEVVTNRATGLDHLPNVRGHKGLDDLALARLYREMDVLFLPLTDSTANNTVLEAIASGLPVVSTDLQAVRAYLPGSEAVLVDPAHETEEMVAALLRLKADVELRLEMGRSARARALELSWPKVALKHANLYMRLATGTLP
jgi:glycosyltransferase involved in cell wall biosynthesis